MSVNSVVVVWGALQHDIPDGAEVDGVEFVAGRRLCHWLRSQEGQPVPKEAAKDLLKRVSDYRAGAWEGTQSSRS